MDLAAEQARMKERWQYRRRVTRDGVTKLLPVEDVEKSEIQILIERTDLKCPVCKVSPVRANRLTGEIRTCASCSMRNFHLLKKYGLTRKQYERILYDQDGKCAVCCNALLVPFVDHCHELNHVRGLVCGSCNTLLGCAKDNEDILINAAKYVVNNRVTRSWHATRLDGSFSVKN